jgi:hypothetical protein
MVKFPFSSDRIKRGVEAWIASWLVRFVISYLSFNYPSFT